MIDAAQRFRRSLPCPICGGHNELPHGRGVRCAGFISGDGEWAYCTREEFAGPLMPNPKTNPPAYAHRLHALCFCGTVHAIPHEPVTSFAPVSRRDYIPRFPGHEKQHPGTIDCTYVYRNERGEPVHRTVRYRNPKSFRQQRREGASWRWGLSDTQPLLYRLPELLSSSPETPVFLVEGEKDADRLARLGLVVTTAPMGAKHWRPQFTEWLRGRHVVVLEDNDQEGRARSLHLKTELADAVLTFRVIQFAGLPEGGDVSDWLDAGGTVDRLIQAAEHTRMMVSA